MIITAAQHTALGDRGLQRTDTDSISGSSGTRDGEHRGADTFAKQPALKQATATAAGS
jgi:hypothetical protein